MQYSEIVLDHFYNPRNAYRMEKADVIGVAGNPERGPFMLLFLKLEASTITKASFQTFGCAPAIAAGSLLSERLSGSSVEQAAQWSEPKINEALGGLPGEKRHCSAHAATALKNALDRISERQSQTAD